MASFAKLGKGNIVEKVIAVSNDVAITEQAGVDFLNNLYQSRDVWYHTSYNTKAGVHLLGGTPFRKNHAAIGFTYDQERDAFIAPKPFASWVLNETTCEWEAPIAEPTDGQDYDWNEAARQWDLIDNS